MRYKKNLFKIFIIMLVTLMVGFQSNYINNNVKAVTEEKVDIMYETHVQDIGWQGQRQNGEMAGTEGQSKRLEAIKIKINNMPETMKIKYSTHIQDIGWQGWKNNGEIAGTEGQSKRLEAIKIKLEETEEYSVMYRVHIQDIGWQDWKYDGEIAGTEGQSKRLEAIEIKIVDKKAKVLMYIDQGKNGSTYYKNDKINICGWKMADVSNTKVVAYLDETPIDENEITYAERPDVIKGVNGYGNAEQNPTPQYSFDIDTTKLTSGQHTIKIDTIDKNEKIIGTITTKIKYDTEFHVAYSAHVQDVGWQGQLLDGEKAGTEGKSLRVEALKINLINAPENVKVKYRVHVQDVGWQDWKYDGDIAGTIAQSKRVEAIKIELENTEQYSIEYRTQIQDVGWQDWANDGEISGTEARSLRIETIAIRIVPKIAHNRITMFLDEPNNKIGAENTKIRGWVMSNIDNIKLKILFNNQEIKSEITRTARKDVLEIIKGYGGEEKNPLPGFETMIDLQGLANQQGNLKIQIYNSNNELILEKNVDINIRPKIEYQSGIYGQTGLRVSGQGGHDLKYLKYGNGPNVYFATFAIHGYEDIWSRDGYELVDIANQFYNKLLNDKDYDLADKWTIYMFPEVNQDGLANGWTNNGPGRTTLYSQAPNNKGIDMNRCWQIGDSYTRFTSNRNYNGTAGFQAYEAQALRDFMLANKSQNGQTLLVDLHGWTQQLIGNEEICSYYDKQFPENNKKSVGRYGTGYMIAWGRTYLGSTNRAAKTALIELPNQGVTGHQSVVNGNFANRYINATLDMLKNMN